MRGSVLVVGIGIALVLLLVLMGFLFAKSTTQTPPQPVGQQVQIQPAVQATQPLVVKEVPTDEPAEQGTNNGDTSRPIMRSHIIESTTDSVSADAPDEGAAE